MGPQGEDGGRRGGQREHGQKGEGGGHGQRLPGVEQTGPGPVEGQPGQVPPQVEEDRQGHGAAERARDGGGDRGGQDEPYGSQPGGVQSLAGAGRGVGPGHGDGEVDGDGQRNQGPQQSGERSGGPGHGPGEYVEQQEAGRGRGGGDEEPPQLDERPGTAG